MTLSQELRKSIHEELMKISKQSHPHVWERSRSKVAYQQLEEQIINMMIAQAITVTTVINLIESDYA
jgi:hypothetical protein